MSQPRFVRGAWRRVIIPADKVLQAVREHVAEDADGWLRTWEIEGRTILVRAGYDYGEATSGDISSLDSQVKNALEKLVTLGELVKLGARTQKPGKAGGWNDAVYYRPEVYKALIDQGKARAREYQAEKDRAAVLAAVLQDMGLPVTMGDTAVTKDGPGRLAGGSPEAAGMNGLQCYECVTGGCSHGACTADVSRAYPAVTMHAGTALCASCARKDSRRQMARRAGGHDRRD